MEEFSQFDALYESPRQRIIIVTTKSVFLPHEATVCAAASGIWRTAIVNHNDSSSVNERRGHRYGRKIDVQRAAR
jgi:hypothetical protein